MSACRAGLVPAVCPGFGFGRGFEAHLGQQTSVATLFAWLVTPFRFQKLGIQASEIPGIKVLVLPRSRLARSCSRAAVAADCV